MLAPGRLDVIIDAGHASADEHLAVSDHPLIDELVQHGIERTLLCYESPVGDAHDRLHHLIAVHLFLVEQSEDHQ